MTPASNRRHPLRPPTKTLSPLLTPSASLDNLSFHFQDHHNMLVLLVEIVQSESLESDWLAGEG